MGTREDRDRKLPTTPDPVGGEISTRSEIDAFLSTVRSMPAQPGTGRRGRLVFALDATASREPTWDRACHIQAEMFHQTAALGGLDVQLVFYRGYGECKASKWHSDPKALGKVMTGVRCLGGQTQIAKILKHAIKETKREKIGALIFVGDAFEEDIDAVCHAAGELGVLGVPVFAFHEGGNPVVARAFKQIATLTRGAYCPFDLSSADRLKELLAAVAVYAAGGRQALLNYGAGRGEAVRLLTSQVRG
ncbi:vWA domain-containing protein [Thalassobaculum sp. OXR-137]|uniref:vWA domain-containing protein n=1 Tax=Thalassobaculum sp. OXR-137 TaxID=3100173 RepID=UPI002AC91885|nr:vWA domain-containing protein [Thalassobaculum sp. OXR-137]WPZ36652.1 vWA domain-containing protein [Thalassobaculum sp. OXR-137]